MYEILMYGLGGQGAVMGSQVFVEAAIRDGKWALVNPEYGGTRRGGTVVCCLRYDTKPIRRVYPVEEADGLFVIGHGLTEKFGLKVKEGGFAVLNEAKSPEEIEMDPRPSKTATVDATGLSFEVFGPRAIPITNTAMLGAICKATGFITLDSLISTIGEKWPGKIGDANIRIAKMAYERVKVKAFTEEG